MAYIGRDTDKLSNIEVLDTITFDGSTSYTLQKNSVNFTPSSANNVLVSIDGVVQANNFTVSGSTIDFGVAVPATSTCDWIYHIGVGLITTPADGTVGLAQLSATGTKDSTTFLRGDNTFASAQGVFESALLHVRDEKSSAAGGSSSAATDNIRTLNTVVTNEISGASLASNQITLPSGTYFINANAPAYNVGRHRIFLYNVTDTAVEILGGSEYAIASGTNQTRSVMFGRFTITAEKDFEIRHYTQSAIATNGLGVNCSDGRTEVYTNAQIWKVA